MLRDQLLFLLYTCVFVRIAWLQTKTTDWIYNTSFRSIQSSCHRHALSYTRDDIRYLIGTCKY